jgi:hypothetical protein
LLPNSLNSAVAVHENATPIDICSPIYVIVRRVCVRKGTNKNQDNPLLSSE